MKHYLPIVSQCSLTPAVLSAMGEALYEKGNLNAESLLKVIKEKGAGWKALHSELGKKNEALAVDLKWDPWTCISDKDGVMECFTYTVDRFGKVEKAYIVNLQYL